MTEQRLLLNLNQVAKEYPGALAPTRVLAGVDLKIQPQESIAIIGPSGCGKSTLLNIIGTLDTPTSGSVTFDGQDLLKLNDTERAQFRNKSIGFVFQLHHLLPQCTSLENVLTPTLAAIQDSKHAHDHAVRLLDRVGLADRMGYPPGKLSGGERQRVAVARALVNQPRLLLADEPTGSLSREGADELARLLLELNREFGMALIVVTHSMEVARLMGRIVELRRGELHPVSGSPA